VVAKNELPFAVCGYGAAFGMGRRHAASLQDAGRARLVAVCDPDAERQAAAREDFPGIETFDSLEELLGRSEAGLVFLVTPHNLHGPQAIACLKAGRHVVLEKPMCLSTREANSMIRLARQKNLVLTVFHNRRWDGDYVTLRKQVEKGAIGDVFSARCEMASFGMNTKWWRAKRAITGGTMYDWGVHMTDWVLGLIDDKIENVTGFSQKRVWTDADVEDEVQAFIRFRNGAVGEILRSHIREVRPRVKWQVMGTRGNIVSYWHSRDLEVTTRRRGRRVTEYVPVESTDYMPFYKNVLAAVFKGAEPLVTPESAARAIAVIEAQMKSAEKKQAVKVAGE
jgi:predicted dehydrogenase